MTRRKTGVRRALAVATALVLFGGTPAAAAGSVTTTEPLQLTQSEVMCDGQEVLVTYAGELRTTELTGAGPSGSWSHFVARLSWQQEEVRYTALATGGFAVPAGGRTSTYYFFAIGRGTDGSRVHVLEVVHAGQSADGTPQVVLDVEQVSCR